MKKLIYLVLCLMIVALCLVACGDENTTESSKPTTESSRPDTTESSTPGSTEASTPNSTTGSTPDSTESSTPDSTESSTPGSKPDEPEVHEHTYENKLSYDDTNHYYKATCEHDDAKKDVEPHDFDETGNCECGYFKLPAFSTLAEAIEIVRTNSYKVVFGKIETSTYSKLSLGTTLTTSWYEISEGFTYVNENNDYANEYYYSYDEDDNVFAIMVQSGKACLPDEVATEENFGGAKINYVFAQDYENASYGVSDFILDLYSLVISGDDPAAKVGTVDGNVVGFGLTMNGCDVSVSFTINEEGIISDAKVTSTGEYNDYECTMTQSTTNENEPKENIYSSSAIKLYSYIITDGNGRDIEEYDIEVEANETIKLQFTEIEPLTAILSLCDISIEVFNNDDTKSDPWIFPIYDKETLTYSFPLSSPGSYTLVITVDGIETISTINVALLPPTSISAEVYDESYNEFNEVENVEMYVNKILNFKAYAGVNYDGSYTAEILGDVAESVAYLSSDEIDGEEVTTFIAYNPGTYVVKLTSTKVENVSCELEIIVKEAPDINEIMTGYYVGYNQENEGLATVKFLDDNKIEVVYVGETSTILSYTMDGEEIVYDVVEGDPIVDEFYFLSNYNMQITIYGYSLLLLPAEEPIPVDPEVEGKTGIIVIEDKINANNKGGTYTYSIDSEGTFTFYDQNGEVTTDVALTKDLANRFTLRWAGTLNAQVMEKTDGLVGLLEGTYKTYQNIGGTDYLSAIVYITPDPKEENVVLGDNTVTVPDGIRGISAVFTAEESNKYIITLAEGETNAIVKVNGTVINGSFVFELSKGESIKFRFNSVDSKTDTFAFTIAVYKETVNLNVGDAHVETSKYGTEIIAKFLPTKHIKYVITLAEDETNAVIENDDGEISFPYVFDAVAGEEVVFYITSKNGEADTIDFSIEEYKIPELVIGTNSVFIYDGEGGVQVNITTSSKAITYELKLGEGVENVRIESKATGTEITGLPYKFNVPKNSTFSFIIYMDGVESSYIDIILSEHEDAPALPDDEF
ncbi:MAG: hypothetical protein J6D23_01440 [Clostridia bacterium]|nr:hypothetical protein [Clostridia bacterium]